VPERPSVTRCYQNHHLDSTRWDAVVPRSGDIIVTTSYKSGTTWMQEILLHLLHGDRDPMPTVHDVSPWVDARFHGPREALVERLEAIEGRRFLKSHLPFDGLPYYPEARYVVVGRDARDVFMSLANHYGSYTESAYSAFNSPDRPGDPFPRCPDDLRTLWQDWISRGWFEWESEGYPMWSNLYHTQTYWNWRHLENLHFVHYNDMLADLESEVRRLAAFCSLEPSDEAVARTVEATTFANVRKRVEATPETEDLSKAFFEGGQRTFFHKGTNGRWRDLLTDEDLDLYEAAKTRVLEPECAKWLEMGGAVVVGQGSGPVQGVR
jgi:aryl sulfotransferase